jgi:hypothetical protein
VAARMPSSPFAQGYGPFGRILRRRAPWLAMRAATVGAAPPPLALLLIPLSAHLELALLLAFPSPVVVRNDGSPASSTTVPPLLAGAARPCSALRWAKIVHGPNGSCGPAQLADSVFLFYFSFMI